jgi:hypothetical protein
VLIVVKATVLGHCFRMPLIALITDRETDRETVERLNALYKDHKQIAPNAWVINVKPSETTKEISEAIFIPKKSDSGTLEQVRHMFFRIESWWGFHSREIWEWMDSVRKADAK